MRLPLLVDADAITNPATSTLHLQTYPHKPLPRRKKLGPPGFEPNSPSDCGASYLQQSPSASAAESDVNGARAVQPGDNQPAADRPLRSEVLALCLRQAPDDAVNLAIVFELWPKLPAAARRDILDRANASVPTRPDR
ncbi:MAG: hypothetical protein K1X74_17470 [Pirellulales bacterium]|nr:hypothetical protein [Pirellulales bacterium]